MIYERTSLFNTANFRSSFKKQRWDKSSVSGTSCLWVRWISFTVSDWVFTSPAIEPREDVPHVAEVDAVVKIAERLRFWSGGDHAVRSVGCEVEELIIGIFLVVGETLRPYPVIWRSAFFLDRHLSFVLRVSVHVILDKSISLSIWVWTCDTFKCSSQVTISMEGIIIGESMIVLTFKLAWEGQCSSLAFEGCGMFWAFLVDNIRTNLFSFASDCFHMSLNHITFFSILNMVTYSHAMFLGNWILFRCIRFLINFNVMQLEIEHEASFIVDTDLVCFDGWSSLSGSDQKSCNSKSFHFLVLIKFVYIYQQTSQIN